MDRTRSNAALFLSVVLLALAVKVFVLDVLYVSGPSMLPTLRPGSFVVHWKLAYGIPIPLKNKYLVRWSSPTEGDVIIYPWLGRHVIKRCRAVQSWPVYFSTYYISRQSGSTGFRCSFFWLLRHFWLAGTAGIGCPWILLLITIIAA